MRESVQASEATVSLETNSLIRAHTCPDLTFYSSYRERKKQKEREDYWKALQHKVSMLKSRPQEVSAESCDDYSFPPKAQVSDMMDVDSNGEDKEDDILSDEETDADSNHAAEHTDAIHPDMVKSWNRWKICLWSMLTCIRFTATIWHCTRSISTIQTQVNYTRGWDCE